MSVHLIGGGRDEALAAPLFARFVLEAAAHAGGTPDIGVLLVLEAGDTESVVRYERLFAAAGAPDAAVRAIVEGEVFDARVLDGFDAIAVGGGLTPAYADAVAPIADAIRDLVAAGAPYLGFSAGAAIAASRALVGGWRLGGVAVGAEDAGEELDEIEVRDGLGLVPFTLDVHAAQWGTVTRLVAAVTAHLATEGYAVDEHTALVLDDGVVEVAGEGAAWCVGAGDPPTIVRLTAG